ncbi:hypothetical protein PAMP_008327 [Pampus punctatissimus]
MEKKEMDFPVEATIHLENFPDKKVVRGILQSHGFMLKDISSDQVRVKGSFLKLRAVKARLEPLLLSSPFQKVSSGAKSKIYNNNSSDVSDGKRNRLGDRDKPRHASSSSPTTSSSWTSSRSTSAEDRASVSPRPDQRMSLRRGTESFVVDADVFNYARRVRKKDIDVILDNHSVKLEELQYDDSFNITLLGKSAKIAAGKLQSLLNDLSRSLRTQEVLLKDMDHDSQTLLERIQKNKDIYNSVLVCLMNDRLHLIGPSRQSYDLKQSLSGRPVDHSGRAGRTIDRNSRKRSSSLPPLAPKTTGRDRDAITNPSPVGARGYSPSKDRDVKKKGAEPDWGAPARFERPLRGRSQSESREKAQAENANSNMLEKRNKNFQFLRKPLLKIPSVKDMKQKLKGSKK